MRTCRCIERVNKELAKDNVCLSVAYLTRLNYAIILVATEKVDPKKRTRRINFAATYCPFCGKLYPTKPVKS